VDGFEYNPIEYLQSGYNGQNEELKYVKCEISKMKMLKASVNLRPLFSKAVSQAFI
jgi:hypothetical protein